MWAPFVVTAGRGTHTFWRQFIPPILDAYSEDRLPSTALLLLAATLHVA